ncbi:hypothetical protein C3L33_10823, partial [Rhododendron williamsianum]
MVATAIHQENRRQQLWPSKHLTKAVKSPQRQQGSSCCGHWTGTLLEEQTVHAFEMVGTATAQRHYVVPDQKKMVQTETTQNYEKGWLTLIRRDPDIRRRYTLPKGQKLASKAQTEFELISAIQREVLEHNDVPPSANSAWRKPIPGSLKIYCDVAIPLGSGKGTAAMVVRNEVGELVDGSTANFPVSSVLQGELEAIRRACYMVEGLKVSPVMIESDSRRAIELSVCMGLQMNLKMEWVKRSGNKIAHQVAAWGFKRTTATCLDFYPLCFFTFFVVLRCF